MPGIEYSAHTDPATTAPMPQIEITAEQHHTIEETTQSFTKLKEFMSQTLAHASDKLIASAKSGHCFQILYEITASLDKAISDYQTLMLSSFFIIKNPPKTLSDLMTEVSVLSTKIRNLRTESLTCREHLGEDKKNGEGRAFLRNATDQREKEKQLKIDQKQAEQRKVTLDKIDKAATTFIRTNTPLYHDPFYPEAVAMFSNLKKELEKTHTSLHQQPTLPENALTQFLAQINNANTLLKKTQENEHQKKINHTTDVLTALKDKIDHINQYLYPQEFQAGTDLLERLSTAQNQAEAGRFDATFNKECTAAITAAKPALQHFLDWSDYLQNLARDLLNCGMKVLNKFMTNPMILFPPIESKSGQALQNAEDDLGIQKNSVPPPQ